MGWKDLLARPASSSDWPTPPPKPPIAPPELPDCKEIAKPVSVLTPAVFSECKNPAAHVPDTGKSMLDHALAHAARGLHVFACERFLGLPTPNNWFTAATTDRGKLVQMWSDDPIADIGCVPEKSGHYCIIVAGATGRESLGRFERQHGTLKPAFRYSNFWDTEHCWFKGTPNTARIDAGLHLIGAGRYVYLSPSWAPDPTAWAR
jgi:hypothetical protein